MPDSSPSAELLGHGEAGVAIYGLLFVIAVLSVLLWRVVAALNGRDRLIQAMVEKQGEASARTADAITAMSVQVALNTSAVGARGIGNNHG